MPRGMSLTGAMSTVPHGCPHCQALQEGKLPDRYPCSRPFDLDRLMCPGELVLQDFISNSMHFSRPHIRLLHQHICVLILSWAPRMDAVLAWPPNVQFQFFPKQKYKNTVYV